jgi:hypothetical protein
VLGDDVAFAGVAGQVELVRRGDVSVRELVELTGAIIIGKTKMPELGLWPFTESVTWGVTRNPWNLERTPRRLQRRFGRRRRSRVGAGGAGCGWSGFDPHPRRVLWGVRTQAAARPSFARSALR